MKIKSKFKDYYDGVNKLHTDEPLFVRNTAEYIIPWKRDKYNVPIENTTDSLAELMRFMMELHHFSPTYKVDACVLAFCGRVYTAVERVALSVANRDSVDGMERSWFWKPSAELLALVKSRTHANQASAEALVDTWSEHQGEQDPKLLALQLAAAAPIVLMQIVHMNYEFTVSPMLRPMGFAKIVPPQQAWQELSMFFGTIAMPEKATVTISDRDRHAQHGFDKHSFRRTSKQLRGEK